MPKQAREDFDFEAGVQLNEEDKAILANEAPDRHLTASERRSTA